jgi:hypothetical protein
MMALRESGLIFWFLGGVGLAGAGNPLANSPTRPSEPADLTILYTNDTRGVLQACGCSHGVLGGLDRRATLVQRVRARGGAVVLVDSGNLADEPAAARLVVEAMAGMGYDAVGLGPLDLQREEVVLREAEAWKLPLIVSNPGERRFPPFVARCRGLRAGEHRVGMVALAPRPDGEPDKDPGAALRPLLVQVRAENDLVILLSQQGRAADEAQVRAQAEEGLIDLLIGNAEAKDLREPLVVGRTWLLPTSEKGYYVGQVEVVWHDGAPGFSFHRVPLDATVPADPALAARIGQYYAAQAQALQDASLRDGAAAEVAQWVEDRYAPASRCQPCHARAFEQWQQHRHARAVESLRAKQRLVPECLRCHSELYRRTGKVASNLGSADGVQCSTCHGDGLIHCLLPGPKRIDRAVPTRVCVSCHDAEHDPDFNERAARTALRHG